MRGVKIIIEISKIGNNGCIKWRVCPYIATYCLEKIVEVPKVAFYCQSGSLQSGINFLIVSFTGVSALNIIRDCESEIVNQVNTGNSYSPTNKSNLIVALCSIKDILLV